MTIRSLVTRCALSISASLLAIACSSSSQSPSSDGGHSDSGNSERTEVDACTSHTTFDFSEEGMAKSLCSSERTDCKVCVQKVDSTGKATTWYVVHNACSSPIDCTPNTDSDGGPPTRPDAASMPDGCSPMMTADVATEGLARGICPSDNAHCKVCVQTVDEHGDPITWLVMHATDCGGSLGECPPARDRDGGAI